jgi:hypothetical protein
MGLKDIDLDTALRRLAERRIDEAMREGKFDNLHGAGQPLNLDPIPAEENARLLWWTLRILRNNDVIPDEVRWRKELDDLRSRLASGSTETQLEPLVAQINTLVRKINTLGTNLLKAPVTPLDLEQERARFRQRTAAIHSPRPNP